ncbi:MAG: histidine kinase [Bacteroidota bacterium]|nr:histidine kinase [Bacteroidota bacterium]
MKVLRGLILLCLLGNAGYSFGQKLRFETLNTRNGLSGNEITCVYEDAQHFLWIGTRDGLNRFDGRRFEVFRNDPASGNSLSGNIVVSILQDKQGIFWIATKDGGLSRYDPKAQKDAQFRQFKNDPGDTTSIATNRLLCLYDWDENYLLIGAEVYSGIFLNKKTLKFSYWTHGSKQFGPQFCSPISSNVLNWIHYIRSYDDKTVYLSFLVGGEMVKVDKATGNITAVHLGPTEVLSINHFFVDSGMIWMSTWKNGLFAQRDSFTPFAKKAADINDLLMCVANLDRDYLLAGTRSSGLYLVNKHTGAFNAYQKNILQPHALPSNQINCLFIDSRNIVWIGTSAGLAKFDNRTWLFDEKEFTDPENDCTILHCHRFDEGNLAVNTSKGMFLSDAMQQKFQHFTFTDRGAQIIPDYILKVNEKYMLGSEEGFFEWKKNTSQIKELPAKILELNKRDWLYTMGVYQVTQILYDTIAHRPGLWLAVRGYGLSYYHLDNFLMDQHGHDVKKPKSLGNNMVRRLAKDNKGNLWIATAGGLSKWVASDKTEENIFENFVSEAKNDNSLPNNEVMDVWCDKHNQVWLTMNGGGLAQFDGSAFTQYLPDNPVSSHSFHGMFADSKDRLWIITKNGLEIFDLKQKKFFHLDVNDGSANTSLSNYFSNQTNGWVSFAAGNRVYSFQPDSLNFKLPYPEIYLAGMNVFGKDYLNEALGGIAHLDSKERFVNFTVSALQFSSPQTVRFQYKLQGLEEGWNNSEDGEIKYTNLPWGKFKLLVRVTNPSGQYSPEKVLAQFVIATPFYASWWFTCLIIVDIGAIIYAFYRYRINQILALQKVRNKIARDLHDDIGSTLGSISFFSEAAKQQMQQSNTDGAEKMLLRIGDTSREMIETMSDIVWSVNPQNDTVKHLTERMRVFADDLIASSEIQLHFESSPDIENLKLTMEQRKNIFLIFKETIYNSIKYSHCKNLYVELKKDHGGLQITIEDDGQGFDVNNYKSKNGNGLRNMRQRSEEIGATFQLESSAKGTVTRLHV